MTRTPTSASLLTAPRPLRYSSVQKILRVLSRSRARHDAKLPGGRRGGGGGGGERRGSQERESDGAGGKKGTNMIGSQK